MTTAERTVVDLARAVPRIDGIAVVDAVLRVGAVTAASLNAQLARHPGHRGIRRAREIAALGDARAESPMESRLRLRVIDAGLPPPRPQWWLTDATGSPTYRLDLAWPEYRVGLDYDGAHHLDRRRQRADIERRNWLVQTGWTVV